MKNSGYIALISVLIISAVLILVVVSTAQLGIGAAAMGIQKRQSRLSSLIAQACAEEALMKLQEDSNYSGSETIAISGQSCQILAVENLGGENRRLKVTAASYNQQKRIKIEVDQLLPRINVSLWQEVVGF